MGMLDLVRAIDRAVNNPMWADLRAPAPWEVPLSGAGGYVPPLTGTCPVTHAIAKGTLPPRLTAPAPHADIASSPTDFEDC